MTGKRTFEVWRDGAWADCTVQDLRCGDRFRAWEDAAKTELAGGMLIEGVIARSDPFEREPGLWAINMEGEHVCAADGKD